MPTWHTSLCKVRGVLPGMTASSACQCFFPSLVIDHPSIYPPLKWLLELLFPDYVGFFLLFLHLAVTKEGDNQVGHEFQ